jgi:hypothetical protein
MLYSYLTARMYLDHLKCIERKLAPSSIKERETRDLRDCQFGHFVDPPEPGECTDSYNMHYQQRGMFCMTAFWCRAKGITG